MLCFGYNNLMNFYFKGGNPFAIFFLIATFMTLNEKYILIEKYIGIHFSFFINLLAYVEFYSNVQSVLNSFIWLQSEIVQVRVIGCVLNFKQLFGCSLVHVRTLYKHSQRGWYTDCNDFNIYFISILNINFKETNIMNQNLLILF